MSKPMSYKLGVWDTNNEGPSYSDVRLSTQAECEAHGRNLAGRWGGMSRYEIHESGLPVNYSADPVTGVIEPLPF